MKPWRERWSFDSTGRWYWTFLVALWIGGTASAWAGEAPSDRAEKGWTFQPLSEVAPPEARQLPPGWSHNPIDRFIAARLAEEGIPPSPEADRVTLIRRATFDLHGLPPSPEEVSAFLGDEGADAYARVIDRLLASPRYGERWGRHWLDVIRFGESRGFERNEIIRNAWAFRDYVIRSFNEDKPFDQFFIEQIAGDAIGGGDPEIEMGTAFLVAGPYDDVGNQDPAQARLIRANTIDEIITAASGAFLGLSVQCARCHDHKFDPIPTEDYYRLYAIFAGIYHGERILATSEEHRMHGQLLRPLEERKADARAALEQFESSVLSRARGQAQPAAEYSLPPVDPHLTEETFPPIEARYVRWTIESNNRDPMSGGNVRVDEFEIWTAGEASRNVALADEGAEVKAPVRRAEDFQEAYAPSLVIDGKYGARWISPHAGTLTVTLPRTERIDRIRFSADRQKTLPANSGEIVFVGEYRIEVSAEGEAWMLVADSRRRPPISDAFARERRLQSALTEQERETRLRLRQAVTEASKALQAVPPLPTVWAGRFSQPEEPTYVFKGGDPQRRGGEVLPASLTVVSPMGTAFVLPSDAPEQQRRLAFARWVVDRENPLTPRVLANRIWHYHFGTGLVSTPSEFGALGDRPSHPELLDWLAARLMEEGWRLKPLHREIMLSQTYRQSSLWRPEASDLDAGNRLLWRFPPRRLSAEELRDSMLWTAGVLDTRAGGPGFRLYRYLQDNVATYVPLDQHGPETYRRAVYHHNARAAVIDLLTEFDLPDCSFPAPRRASTTSPLQALTLLNHSFTLDMAEALSKRLRHGWKSSSDQVGGAFQLAFQRSPLPEETAASLTLIENHGLPAFCRGLFNANEFSYVE